MRKITPATVISTVALGVSLTGTGLVGANAAGLIHNGQIASNAVNTRVIKNGSVHYSDLAAGVQAGLAKHATNGKDGATGGTGAKGDKGDKGDPGTPAPTDTWVIDNGHGRVTGANTADLIEGYADSAGASLSSPDLSIPLPKGSEVGFTYSLANGAKATWGAPRLVVEVKDADGNTGWYSSVGNTTADYGTDNGDGTFTEYAVPVTGNDEQAAPRGTVIAAALVYDATNNPGTVHVSDVKIGDAEVSFR